MEDDLQESSNKITSFIKENLLVVVLFAAGLLLLVGGIVTILNNPKPEITLEQSPKLDSKQKDEQGIFVDIEGAVVKPGVYKLKTDSRIQDVLIAAGGLSQDADRSYVEKKLNLAQRLSDGLKIYVPKISEGNSMSLIQQDTGQTLININTASIPELDSLPGIGNVTAQKIIDGRPYGAIEELLNKKAVNSSVYEKIKEKISVN